MKEYFEAKKAELLEEKAKVEAKDYSEEILSEINDFKAQKEKEIEEFSVAVEKKYDDLKKEDCKKIDYYLEFIDGELAKIVEKEAEELAVSENTEEQPVLEAVAQ